MEDDRLEARLGEAHAARARVVRLCHAQQITHVAPKLLAADGLDPDEHVVREGEQCRCHVLLVDGHAVRLNVPPAAAAAAAAAAARLRIAAAPQQPQPHLCVKRAHAHRGAPAHAAGAQSVGAICTRVDHQPACVEEAAHRQLRRPDEVATLLEHLCDLRRAEPADQAHVEEHQTGGRQVAQVYILPARQQPPVEPWRLGRQARQQRRRRAAGRAARECVQHVLARRWLDLLDRGVPREMGLGRGWTKVGDAGAWSRSWRRRTQGEAHIGPSPSKRSGSSSSIVRWPLAGSQRNDWPKHSMMLLSSGPAATTRRDLSVGAKRTARGTARSRLAELLHQSVAAEFEWGSEGLAQEGGVLGGRASASQSTQPSSSVVSASFGIAEVWWRSVEEGREHSVGGDRLEGRNIEGQLDHPLPSAWRRSIGQEQV
eukprot:scaffold2920_cov62-Phaeocystis_antarctica.AAC.5